jgi:uncharacterized protein YggE
MEAEIIVQGRGEARSMPDRATIHCVIDAEGPSHQSAYDDAAASAKRVDDVLASRRHALGRVTTAALVVHPKTRWKKGESVRTGWTASRLSTVEVTGFDELGILIAELGGAGASLTGPSWQLDVANPVHREVRRLAAEDAKQRAYDYASALGLEVGGIAWISEPGLRPSLQTGQPMGGFAVAAAARLTTPQDIIEVTPEEIVSEAWVEVGFRIGVPAESRTT